MLNLTSAVLVQKKHIYIFQIPNSRSDKRAKSSSHWKVARFVYVLRLESSITLLSIDYL